MITIFIANTGLVSFPKTGYRLYGNKRNAFKGIRMNSMRQICLIVFRNHVSSAS